jgi:hypothetical protein
MAKQQRRRARPLYERTEIRVLQTPSCADNPFLLARELMTLSGEGLVWLAKLHAASSRLWRPPVAALITMRASEAHVYLDRILKEQEQACLCQSWFAF